MRGLFVLVLWVAQIDCLGHTVSRPDCVDHWRSLGLKSADYVFTTETEKSYETFQRKLKRKECEKEWTVIIYMAANNDLRPFSYRDIWEMERVGSGSTLDVVVFLHTGRRWEKGKETQGQGGPRYYHIIRKPSGSDYQERFKAFVKKHPEFKLDSRQNQKAAEEAFLDQQGSQLIVSPVVKNFSKGDSGSIDDAATFLRWAYENFPSRRVQLIGWSHGQGFDAKLPGTENEKAEFRKELEAFKKEEEKPPSKPTGRRGGFAFDESSGHHLYPNEIFYGLKKLNDDLRGGRKVDIVGSDACYMGDLAIAVQGADAVRFQFGSATIVQKKGFNYRTFLEWFSRHAQDETQALAAKIVELYGNSVSKQGSGHLYSSYYDPYSTMAVWDSERVVFFDRALNELGAQLNDWLDGDDSVGRRVSEMQAIVRGTIRFGGISDDLFHFLQLLEDWSKSNYESASQRKDFQEMERWQRIVKLLQVDVSHTLTAAVLKWHTGVKYMRLGEKGGFRLSRGVSVWIPSTADEFVEMFPKYLESTLYHDEDKPNRASEWARWIRNLYPHAKFPPEIEKNIEKYFR
ncbi:MAG: hypothetical protein HY537_00930 [Deltaproteobacteria bacterium]|nr:hypothetical protein [Deltaproteobacteria bacterium]